MRHPRRPLTALFTLCTGSFLCVVATACGGMSDTDQSGTNDQSSRSAKQSKDSANEQASADDGAEELEGAEEAEETAELAERDVPSVEDPSGVPEAEPLDVVDVEDVRVEAPATRGAAAEAEEKEETAEDEEAAPWGIEFVDDLSVLVIFDNSGSMDAHWENGSRWDVANQALYDALAPVATSLKVAAIRFPLESECGVPEFASSSQFGWQLAGEFLTAWDEQSVRPVGGTPLGQAFLAADQAIANAQERGLLEDRFNVMVLTDGEPNCNTDPAMLTELPAKWLERGVKTHVLGLPGSSAAAQLLQSIAEAGGTEHFVSLGSARELEDEVLHLTR